MSFGMLEPYGTPFISETVVRFHRMRTSPFTSSFAVGAVHTPRFPEATLSAQAIAFTCPTRSFHAVDVSGAPPVAVGSDHQAAAANAVTAKVAMLANENQNPCFMPRTIGFSFLTICSMFPRIKSARLACANSKRNFDSNQIGFRASPYPILKPNFSDTSSATASSTAFISAYSSSVS